MWNNFFAIMCYWAGKSLKAYWTMGPTLCVLISYKPVNQNTSHLFKWWVGKESDLLSNIHIIMNRIE